MANALDSQGRPHCLQQAKVMAMIDNKGDSLILDGQLDAGMVSVPA